MKKTITLLAAAGILITSGLITNTVEAKSHQGEKEGLQNALEHVENEHAHDALHRTMEWKADREVDNEDSDEDFNEHQMTSQQLVEKDKAALAIDYGGSDTAGSVTVSFDSLPSRGANGSSITWKSSNTAIISDDGKVVQQPTTGSTDYYVTMTATLKYGDAVATKAFELTVKSAMTAAQKVAADKTALAVGFSQGDSAESVTLPLVLDITGKYGSSISWISGSPTIISNDGKTVNRPSIGSGDAVVVLTAIISNSGISVVKTFQVTVKSQLADLQKVAADKAALAIGFQTGDSASSVTHALTLPTIGANGSSITWMSSNPTLISIDGKTVNRPVNGTGDGTVVLTAIINSNGVSDAKTFTVIVKQQLTDSQKVAADKEALAIGFSESDTQYSVTNALSLPTIGWNGSSIVWISGNKPIISDDGKTVVRPTGTTDIQVTITAIIMSNGSVDTKGFTVTVKHQ
ncbi:immunoglobulin-like domain-containing protein [Paenibacillus sp. GP183]|uniref:immunoglobulin-like domain-containing protein n=1 Tax=Paenibacillus sp. GP183 TaxID=1882751 RepID=UPI001115422E|nr:immunoglobulin-like domain-containing protein [Paenibacillus sp. GP183]